MEAPLAAILEGIARRQRKLGGGGASRGLPSSRSVGSLLCGARKSHLCKACHNPKVKPSATRCPPPSDGPRRSPVGTDLTVLGLLAAMISGRMQPMYTLEGKFET